MRNIAILVIVPLGLLSLFLLGQERSTIVSRWGGPGIQAESGLSGHAEPLVAVAAAVPADERLAQFNAGSQLEEQVADGALQFFRRSMPDGGELAYFVVKLNEAIHVSLINADGATPGSDASGDTTWTDGQQHLATVPEMANAPYAAHEGFDLFAAMAFGFHGAERTSNEGTVVIDGVIHRVNPGRATLCITPDRQAQIGIFNAEQLQRCAQAVGAGPVILWNQKIASTSIAQETETLLPFNPLGEDFVQLDWRKQIYNGLYPKTAIGIGRLNDGTHFLVLITSSDLTGETLAQALRDMGCQSALGGDDDTSTQATWRGQSIWSRNGREVPDAVAVYVRN